MKRTFIEVPLFTRRWSEIGLTDVELFQLQIAILKDPEAGPVMEGTGGIRKVRFPLEHRGKSGSVRVCYVDFAILETVYLMAVYQKNEKENLSKKECNDIKRIIEQIEQELGGEKK